MELLKSIKNILVVLNIIIHNIIVIPTPYGKKVGRESHQGITIFENTKKILLKILKYWNRFCGKEEERRGRGGEECLKRKKRERESRKKVKTNPMPQKREREKGGGTFHKKPVGKGRRKERINKIAKKNIYISGYTPSLFLPSL